MKKFLAIIVLAGAMTACNNSGDTTTTEDTAGTTVDTMNTMVDTTQTMGDSTMMNADSTQTPQ